MLGHFTLGAAPLGGTDEEEKVLSAAVGTFALTGQNVNFVRTYLTRSGL
jgi:hypothetical protein